MFKVVMREVNTGSEDNVLVWFHDKLHTILSEENHNKQLPGYTQNEQEFIHEMIY